MRNFLKLLLVSAVLIVSNTACNDTTIDEPQCPMNCCPCFEGSGEGSTDSPSDADDN